MGDLMDDTERTIRRLRIDARRQQEEAEAVVAELARASRTLRDAVLDHGRAGRGLRVEVGESVIVGRAVHVGTDLVRIMGSDRQPVDVAFAAVSGIQVSGGDSGSASVSTGYPDTLLARARELVQVNAGVEIGRFAAPAIRGRLMAATVTHLEVDDPGDRSWIVPAGAVAWIRRSDA